MRTLTIIDTSSHLHEIHLDDYGKRRLVFGRSREECDVVIADPIISKIHGVFFFQGSKTMYADCESSNGTYIEEPGQNRLLNREMITLRYMIRQFFELEVLKNLTR